MKIYSPQLKGTTTVATGSNVSLTGSFSGSIAGIDINANNTFTSSTNTFTASISGTNTFTSSTSARLSSIETITASNVARINALETKSASVDTTNTTQNTRLTNLENKTGSLASTGSNTLIGDQIISGTVYIQNNLVVQGSSSLQNITASAVSIGTNTVLLNTANPSVRYAGISAVDSGSAAGKSGSLYFDSRDDEWIFVHQGNLAVTSSIMITGPETYDNLGNETKLTTNIIPKVQSGFHIVDSCIIDNGTTTCIKNNLVGTGTACFGSTVIAGSSIYAFANTNYFGCTSSNPLSIYSDPNDTFVYASSTSTNKNLVFYSNNTNSRLKIDTNGVACFSNTICTSQSIICGNVLGDRFGSGISTLSGWGNPVAPIIEGRNGNNIANYIGLPEMYITSNGYYNGTSYIKNGSYGSAGIVVSGYNQNILFQGAACQAAGCSFTFTSLLKIDTTNGVSCFSNTICAPQAVINCIGVGQAWSTTGGVYQTLQVKGIASCDVAWFEGAGGNDAGIYVGISGCDGKIGTSYRSAMTYGGLLFQTTGQTRLTIAANGITTFGCQIQTNGGCIGINRADGSASGLYLGNTSNTYIVQYASVGGQRIAFVNGAPTEYASFYGTGIACFSSTVCAGNGLIVSSSKTCGDIGIVNSSGYGWIYAADANHSIIIRGNRAGTAADYTNYYQYGGNLSAGKGHLFWTGGLLSNQTLKLHIADDGIQVSVNLAPSANNTYCLGTSTCAWAHIYTNDLHLSNEGKCGGNDIDGTNGNWTIQEGSENLYIINNKNNKKFKIQLQEII
jgi:hypothetical protein